MADRTTEALGPHVATPMELAALHHAIATVKDRPRREALLRQVEELRVKQREFTGAGFYTYFECPDALRSADIIDESNRDPPRMGLYYPGGHGHLSFLVYVRDGAIDFLEGASSGMWYEEQAAAGCWPEDPGPVRFDPALITD